MSMDSETRLRRALMRLSNERTESGVKAALALALWDGVDVPQDVRDVIDSMDGQVVDESLKHGGFMFTFNNLFAGAAGLCLMALVLHLVVDGSLGGAVIWTVGAVVFLCASNACKGKKG